MQILRCANALELLRRHLIRDATGASLLAGRDGDLGQIIGREKLSIAGCEPVEASTEVPPITCGVDIGQIGRVGDVAPAPGFIPAQAVRTAALSWLAELLGNARTTHNENNGPGQCERDRTTRELPRAPASELLRDRTSGHGDPIPFVTVYGSLLGTAGLGRRSETATSML